jgi:hypothetical protein
MQVLAKSSQINNAKLGMFFASSGIVYTVEKNVSTTHTTDRRNIGVIMNKFNEQKHIICEKEKRVLLELANFHLKTDLQNVAQSKFPIARLNLVVWE